MSTLRYRVVSPTGIYIGETFYATTAILNLTEEGARYLLLNKRVALAATQAVVGVPDGPSEDDVKIDIIIGTRTKTVSLTELRAMFPDIQGPRGLIGPAGPLGPKGDKGDVGRGISLSGVVATSAFLRNDVADNSVYVAQDSGHGWARANGIWIDIGPFRGPQGEQGLQGSPGIQGLNGSKGEQGPKGDQGIQGIQGPKGDKGDRGCQGDQGIQGVAGPQGDQGIQGQTGIQGPKGDKGDAASVTETAGTLKPLADSATGAVGTSVKWAHEDHQHPSDTTKANIDSPGFTGTPKAPTATAGTNTDQIATCAFVLANGLVPASNLSDVKNVAQARSNLGLGPYATASVGQLPGAGNSTAIAAGMIGERISAALAFNMTASGQTITGGSIILTPGVWDIEFLVNTSGPGATSTTDVLASLVNSGGTLTTLHYRAPSALDLSLVLTLPRYRVAISANTTYYVNLQATFSGSSYGGGGTLFGTRVS